MGAYSAPPDPLAGFEGPLRGDGGERSRGKGGEGKGRGKQGTEGKREGRTKENALC